MYIQQYKIRSQEIHPDRSISYPAIIQLLQETSMQHIIKLGGSFWDMKEAQTSWVLLKKEIEILGSANLGDRIEVRTFPSGFEKIFAYRDYHMYHGDSEIARATSTWALIDLNTRKPLVADITMFEKYIPQDRDILSRARYNLKPMDSHDYQNHDQVSFYDLDWNNHINNQSLCRKILSQITRSFLDEKVLIKIQLQFKTEAMYGDQLLIYNKVISETEQLHWINNQEGKLIMLAKTYWKRKGA